MFEDEEKMALIARCMDELAYEMEMEQSLQERGSSSSRNDVKRPEPSQNIGECEELKSTS